MTTTLHDRYPRTLFEWLKTDDKKLLKAIAAGETVLDAAEALQREHVSVIRRLDHLELFQFDDHSEEWVEIMTMCLGGVPMCTAIEWCSAAEDRLPLEMIDGMAMSELRKEFELALNLKLIVANCDVIEDLTWLAGQPAEVQAGYQAACDLLVDRFEVLTPRTLKNQMLGISPAPCVRNWATARPSTSTPARSTRRRFRKSSTTRTVYAKKRSGRYSKRSTAR